MYRGVASADMVVRMGRAGMLGFLGAGGMRLEEVASSVDSIRSGLADGQAYGVNLLADHNRPDR